jgi:hypothetical protein
MAFDPIVYERDILTLACAICKQEIGTFNRRRIHLPLTSDQFMSLDPDHGRPPPFPFPNTEYQFLLCPYCRKRAFTSPNTLEVSLGRGKTKPYRVKRTYDPLEKYLAEQEKKSVEKQKEDAEVEKAVDRRDGLPVLMMGKNKGSVVESP